MRHGYGTAAVEWMRANAMGWAAGGMTQLSSVVSPEHSNQASKRKEDKKDVIPFLLNKELKHDRL
jgi:hypothetical protein